MVKLAVASAAATATLLLTTTAALSIKPPVECTSALGGPVVVSDVDYKTGTKVQCTLTREPTDTVSAVLRTSKNLLISQCNLVWTPANWSSIATLQLYPGAGMKTTTTQSEFSENVDMVLTSKDSTFNITKFSPLSVQRVVQAMATCSSFGDPHIVTFDGLKFDNYLAGWHTYMQSERTTIQAFHGECGFRSRLCNMIIALQHGGEYLRIMADAPQNTTDLKTEFRFSVENPTQISVDTLNPDSKAFTVLLSDGTSIRITVAARGTTVRYSMLSFVITAPGKYLATGMTGLCGNFDGQVSNDECVTKELNQCSTYLCADGQCCNDVIVAGAVNPTTCRQTVPLELQLCQAPVVPKTVTSTTNIPTRSTLNTVPPAATTTTMTTIIPAHSTLNTVPPAATTTTNMMATTTMITTTTATTPCPTSSVVPAATPVTVTVEQCTSHCKTIFEGVTCTSVDVTPYIDGCIADTTLVTSSTELFEIASQTLESYLGACTQCVQGLANSPFTQDQTAAATSAADNGIVYTPVGTNVPVNTRMECLNGGKNNAFGGCDCPVNFSGLRCNVDNRQSLTSQNGAASSLTLGVSSMMIMALSTAMLMF